MPAPIASCALRGGPLAERQRPLRGKRVVLTRATEQSAEWKQALESLGAEVVLLPAVCFAPPNDWGELDAALRRLPTFDAILFTSKNAVRYFFERSRALGISPEVVGAAGRMIAAVGTATGGAFGGEGVRVTYVAQESTGEGLAKELRGSLYGRKVLLPRSDRGDDRLPSALRDVGARVTEVVAYRTTTPVEFDEKIVAQIRGNEVDTIVFASPSAFHNLSRHLGPAEMANISWHVQFAAIGPTTARAIRESGAAVAIECEEPSAAGLARALTDFYLRHPSSAAQS